MSTAELFHLNNNIRLLSLALNPIKKNRLEGLYLPKNYMKVVNDVSDPQFKKTIEQTTKIY